MHDLPTLQASGRSSRRRLLLLIVLTVGILAASVTWLGRFGQPPPHALTQEEQAAIAAVIQRETRSPLRALTPQSDGTVQAFVGGEQEPGGQLLQLRKLGGNWRIEHTTLLF